MTAPVFRLSRQRKVILEELRKTTSHPTADDLYMCVRRILPKISLGTIYRNLDFLCDQGMIQRVGNMGSQMRFDGNPEPHAHIRCSVCDKVVDLPWEVRIEPDHGKDILGFEISGCIIEYYGLCPDCRANQPTGRKQ